MNTRKLQAMIDRCVKAQNEYYLAQCALNEWCADEYGAEPGDVDADEIIDGVFGGCGVSNGMTAANFNEVMKRLTKS